jgi:hypothetical protein
MVYHHSPYFFDGHLGFLPIFTTATSIPVNRLRVVGPSCESGLSS